MAMSNFTVTTAISKDILIVRPCGYVDEKGGAELAKVVNEALSQEVRKVVINFSESPVINSQGIAQIIEIAEIIVDEIGGDLAFVGLSELASGVFKMVGLLQMADLYGSESEAVDGIAG